MKLTPRKTAELIESGMYNQAYHVQVQYRKIQIVTREDAFIDLLNLNISAEKGRLDLFTETYNLDKDNVLYVIKELLQDGTERTVLNSNNPGKDDRSCKNKREIYSLAYIKRNFFDIREDDSYKHTKFRKYLQELAVDGSLKLLKNRGGSVIGCELLERKVSNAEKLLRALAEHKMISENMTCGANELYKECNSRSYSKNRFYNKDYVFEVIVDPKNEESFFLSIMKEGTSSLYARADFITRYRDILLKSDFLKLYQAEIEEVSNEILTDIRNATKSENIRGTELEIQDKNIGFRVNF